MHQIPTTSELASLGIDLDRDGFTTHEDRVATMVDIARRGEPLSVALDALGDLTAPDVVRARAFAAVAARWDLIRHQALNNQAAFDDSFALLLEKWVAHQELRQASACPEKLWESRRVLDRLRLSNARRRQRLVGSTSR